MYKIVAVHKKDAYHSDDEGKHVVGMIGNFVQEKRSPVRGYKAGNFRASKLVDRFYGSASEFFFLAVKVEEV